MAINEFNLNEIFAREFGYTPFSQNFKVKPEDVLKRSQVGNYGPYYAKDLQNRDVFMPLTLGGPVDKGGTFLPYVWVNVSFSKLIVETPMTERRGSVKEKITTEDFVFGVKGFFIGHDGTFPEKDVEGLRALFDRDEALECKSVLTDIFLLSEGQNAQDKVVIYNGNLHENKGVEHVRGFEFMMKSDQPFELEIV